MNPYYLIKAIKNDLYYHRVRNVLFAINKNIEFITEFESNDAYYLVTSYFNIREFKKYFSLSHNVYPIIKKI